MQLNSQHTPLHDPPRVFAQQCEDLEDAASLGLLFRMVKAAIMLNDASVLEELLKEVRGQQCGSSAMPDQAGVHGLFKEMRAIMLNCASVLEELLKEVRAPSSQEIQAACISGVHGQQL